MIRTNTTVEIYKNEVDWKGNSTPQLIGTYDGWLEHGSNLVFVRDREGRSGVTEMGKGTLFLFDDVNLDNAYFMVDGTRRDILQWYRYVDGKNRFHHIEVIYQ